MLQRLGRIVEENRTTLLAGERSGGPEVPGLNTLTARQFDLVARLLEGDRVPAIASTMFLSQSTVRSHLASVFRKVGVTSQQELLDLIRDAQRPRAS
jgi:DNA-binding NarL/FixJ family response regulator